MDAVVITVMASIVATLLAATPSPPVMLSDPATIEAGSSVRDFVFVPSGSTNPIAVAGRPTVLVVFSSSCTDCMKQEIPKYLADYAKYHDRVNFLGIDYYEESRDSIVRPLHIPFPIEFFGSTTDLVYKGSSSYSINGATAKNFAQVVPLMKEHVPPETYAALQDVAKRCASMTQVDCDGAAANVNVYIDGTVHVPPGHQPVSLPLAFVIYPDGTVMAKISGSSPNYDLIPRELEKMGVTP
jgi:thiol-disulfide isomerase/thioredoxin